VNNTSGSGEDGGVGGGGRGIGAMIATGLPGRSSGDVGNVIKRCGSDCASS